MNKKVFFVGRFKRVCSGKEDCLFVYGGVLDKKGKMCNGLRGRGHGDCL